MDEEKIFGPFTLRQFIYFAFGLGVAYLVYKTVELNIAIPIIIVIIGAVIILIRNSPAIVMDERYIKAKKFQFKNPDEYSKWLQKKIAEIQSQISMRKARGLVGDPTLESVLKMFENIRDQERLRS